MSVDAGITAALTPEEWAEGDKFVPRTLHALAAKALQGQPFGFTWEDVEDCEVMAGIHRLAGNEKLFRRWRNRADRIAALLPPRDPP